MITGWNISLIRCFKRNYKHFPGILRCFCETLKGYNFCIGPYTSMIVYKILEVKQNTFFNLLACRVELNVIFGKIFIKNIIIYLRINLTLRGRGRTMDTRGLDFEATTLKESCHIYFATAFEIQSHVVFYRHSTEHIDILLLSSNF